MVQATVCFPVVVDLDNYKIEIDESRRNDSEYMESIKNKIKDVAAEIMQTCGIDALIHNCDEYPELID